MDSKTLTILIKAKDEASAALEGVAGKTSSVGSRIASAAKIATIAVAAMATAFSVNAVKAAGDYQSSLSQLRQASSATSDEMSRMSTLAQQLGRDNNLAGVTAADAAATMTELSKAGLSVNDTMDAAKGTMSLAKAGNIEFADAATIAASALNAFSLSGKDANKVADVLAAGANASQAELSDLALGLQQSATVAKQFNLGLDNTVTALALFANNGIKGSDAGTSLKTMLIALANPTTSASDAMKQIGFSAYDANGKFIGLREMSERLNKSLAGLTDQQKQATLATIFGTDAFRAAAVLADNAGASYDSMNKSVNESGAATKAAAAQMGGYEKAMEALSNNVSDVALQVGTALLPAVTEAANAMSDGIGPAFNDMKAAGTAAIKALSPAIRNLKEAIGKDLVNAVNSFVHSDFARFIGTTVVAATGLAITAVAEAIKVFSSLVRVVQTVAPAIVGAVAGVAAYKAAIIAMNAIQTVHNALLLAQGIQFTLLNGQLIAVRTATVAQTVAQTALNLVMSANPIGLVIAAVAALAGGLAMLASQTNKNKDADNALKLARQQMAQATNAARDAQNQLRDAQLNQEGASLRVEQAQKTYNDAVAQFGPKSLEARQAAYDLKVAQDNLKDANNNAAEATDKNKDAQKNLAQVKSKVEESEKLKKSVIEKTTQSMREQANRTSDLFGSLNALNGRNFSYTVTQNNKTVGSDITHKASGGPVKANEPYFVGDNPDGSINKTTELFIPNTSGTIMSSSDLQAALSGAKNGPQRIDKSSTFNMYGNIQLGDASAVDRFFEKMDKQAQLANAGVGV